MHNESNIQLAIQAVLISSEYGRVTSGPEGHLVQSFRAVDNLDDDE